MANSIVRQQLKYAASDFVTSAAGVFLYNVTRFFLNHDIVSVQGFGSLSSFLSAPMVVAGQFIFPVAMMVVYWLSGYYNDVFRRSLLQEFVVTLMSTFVNMLMIFFVALINDTVAEHYHNYELLFVLWGILFILLYPSRLAITIGVKRRIARSDIEFETLMIGCSDRAFKFVKKISDLKHLLGYKVIGYVNSEGCECNRTDGMLPVYSMDELAKACKQHDISDFIVVPPQGSDAAGLLKILNMLFPFNKPIKVLPDEANLLLSRVKLVSMYDEPFIDVSSGNMSNCETNIKRFVDCILSGLVLLVLSPFFAVLAILIKCMSKGPVIYKQERIGRHGRPFIMYKFRTMRVNAECDGKPCLTKDDDERIVPLGKFMRKYRIDELPQFWNVLKGDMSIVGPRPERKYFIDQIVPKAPYYTLLHQVRPGITSLGMVKYGYAKNVDEMVERLKFDLLYIENMSLLNDLKIIIYTVKTVITGKGI